MVPNEYIGAVMELCQNKRGIYKDMHYIDANRNTLEYEIPLGEIVFDFFDKLKSCTKGYASLDYEISEYKKSDLVKMDILLNGELIDALSIIVHRDFAYARGNSITVKLKELIPKQQFEIPVQAAVEREDYRAHRISSRSAKTFWPSVTAAIFHERRSCWKNRRKAKSG